MSAIAWLVPDLLGRGGATESPIGCVPRPQDLDLDGLEGVSDEKIRELLAVKPEEWEKELAGQEVFFKTLEPYVPEELLDEHKILAKRLGR